MADLNSTLSQSVVAPNDFVVEPFNAPTDVLRQARKFFPEEVYNLSSQTTLYKFLLALLGDAGVGGMKKAITYTRTHQALSNVRFEDLDTLFAGPLSFPRQVTEAYSTDPSNSLLTDAQWLEVHNKDSNYRSRANDYTKGLNLGSTIEGYSLIAKAATGYDSDIYEQWQYYDDLISDEPVGFPNLGNTTSRNEIVVLPKTDGLTQSQARYLSDAFNRVKNINSVISFTPQGNAAINIPVQQVVSSSDFYYTQKIVTGNPAINYPSVSEANNTWIVAGSAVEAPTYAFGNTQESVTYAPITSSSASTTQIGPFNQTQQAVFGYLQNVPSNLTIFSSDQSYVDNSQNLEISTPWAVRQNTLNLFANGQYPVGYFAITGQPTSTSKTFWASQENYIYDQNGNGKNRTTESITLNLQTTTPVNMIEFEIGKKPVDIQLNYLDSDNTTWLPVNLNRNVENVTSVYYNNSTIYQWQPSVITFDTVMTTGLQLVFTRRTDIFPFDNPTGFPWSVEIRNFKAALMIGQQSDFVSFPGVDVFGNGYYTQLQVYGAQNILNGGTSFWQSQSNPSQFAVESLYFDVTSLQGSAQTIDQIYIDPLTIGNLMHVYYTNDNSTDNPADFGDGDLIWYDGFTNSGFLSGEGVWSNYNFIWQQNFPSFEKYTNLNVSQKSGPYYSLYESNNAAGASGLSIAGNITSQQYGQGDTIVTFANPGNTVAGTAAYFELDVCLQGNNLNTGYSLQYLTGVNNNKPTIQLNSYNNAVLYNSISVNNLPLFQPGDQLGIRNDAANNQAIAYAIQSNVTIPIGTVSIPASAYGLQSYGNLTYGGDLQANSFNNYGYTAIIIEDPSNVGISINSIEFRKNVANTVNDWDYKLWNPINKHYRIQKGFLNLPNPITAKYIKLEFSKLTPVPYESIYNPNLPLVEYNAYPSWVVAYINDTFSQVTSLNQLKAENVNYDLINTGIQKPNQTLLGKIEPQSTLDYIKSLSVADVTQIAQNQYNKWFAQGSAFFPTPANQVPQIYPNTLYQEDGLFSTVQNPNVLSQAYSGANQGAFSNYSQESGLTPPVVGPITARSDNSIIGEKNYPDLWFPRICRHGYQTVQTRRDNKLAYSIAINQIGFYKKDRSVPTNDSFYFETLADISNADSNYPNTFVQTDWKFSVPTTTLTYGYNLPEFGFENFDQVNF